MSYSEINIPKENSIALLKQENLEGKFKIWPRDGIFLLGAPMPNDKVVIGINLPDKDHQNSW